MLSLAGRSILMQGVYLPQKILDGIDHVNWNFYGVPLIQLRKSIGLDGTRWPNLRRKEVWVGK